jgi:hypothetical protein
MNTEVQTVWGIAIVAGVSMLPVFIVVAILIRLSSSLAVHRIRRGAIEEYPNA